ncbi:MAG: GNAT family N-acetyltransferase [Burkholderiaceae bacterium]|nr:GNAT family N-acetyltransferase [Burkholderiaceae bacterium]MDO9089529.1 GNAT family N-acetyltransferase [Burkholderiaceae bacterium]MDP1968882.1 GNAT family N-acetyltransferase [Burkholderiaceae bacterium]
MPLTLTHECIVPFAKEHDRITFDCGNDDLNRYLKQQARQDAEKHVAVPFVLLEPGSPVVRGFYTLSASIIPVEELPPDMMKKLPRYGQLPVTLLGRLAVDQTARRQGVGEFLLVDALRRCLEGSQLIGAMAVIVDAKDAQAESFYRYFDFLPFQFTPRRLFLPMRQIAQLFSDLNQKS